MLTGGDVARIFDVSEVTVKNWRDKGILVPEYKYSTGRYGYTEEQVEEFRMKSKRG